MPASPKKPPSIQRNDYGCGGVGQSMVPLFAMHSSERTTITRMDVSRENQRTSELFSRIPNAETLTVGNSDTSLTLLASNLGPNHPIYQQIGIAAGEDGLAQARQCGHIATKRLVGTQHYKDVCKRHEFRKLIASNGVAPISHETFYMGAAGGTSSSGALVLALDQIERCLATSSTVHVLFNCVDSQAYIGLGENIHRNASAFLEEGIHILRQIRNKYPPDKVVIDINMVALRATLDKDQAHDRLVQTSFEALACPDYQDRYRRSNANEVLLGPLGNLNFITVDQWYPITRKEVVEATSALYYQDLYTSMERLGVPAVRVRSLEISWKNIPLPRPSTDDLLQVFEFHTDQEIQHELEAPAAVYRPGLHARTLEGEEVDLERLQEVFSEVPTSHKVAINRILLAMSIKSALSKELRTTKWRIERIGKKLKRSRRAVERRLAWLRNHGEFLLAGNPLVSTTEKLLEDHRNNSDKLHSLKALLDYIPRHIRLCDSEIRVLSSRLQMLLECLDRYRAKSEAEDPTPRFLVKDLEVVFPEVLAILDFEDHNQELVLGSFVKEVTLEGLRCLSGAKSNNIEEIVDLFASAAPFPGPGVGGVRAVGAAASWVFPQLDARLKSSLLKQFEVRLPGSTILFNDKVRMGLEVTKILDYRPLTIENAFPGVLRAGLEESHESPRNVLFHSPEAIARRAAAMGNLTAATPAGEGSAPSPQTASPRQAEDQTAAVASIDRLPPTRTNDQAAVGAPTDHHDPVASTNPAKAEKGAEPKTI